MKQVSFFSLVLTLALAAFTLSNCGMEEETEQSCAQEEICPTKSVTACCTEDACTYDFNGKTYASNQVNQLASDLGCPANARLAAGEDEHEALVIYLEGLLQQARNGLNE